MKTIHIPYRYLKSAFHAALYGGGTAAIDKLVRERGGLIRCNVIVTGTNAVVPAFAWADPEYPVIDGILDLQPSEWQCHDRSERQDHSPLA